MRILGLTVGDWRTQPTQSAGLFKQMDIASTPGVYVVSAKACGLKGAINGARHSWVSVFNGKQWTSAEITDEETLRFQSAPDGDPVTWECHGSPSSENSFRAPFVSDRTPDGLWFGQQPRLELCFPGSQPAADFLHRLEEFCDQYKFKDVFTLLNNNCSKFVSYLLWRNGLVQECGTAKVRKLNLVGFKEPAYWRTLYQYEHQSEALDARLSAVGQTVPAAYSGGGHRSPRTRFTSTCRGEGLVKCHLSA